MTDRDRGLKTATAKGLLAVAVSATLAGFTGLSSNSAHAYHFDGEETRCGYYQNREDEEDFNKCWYLGLGLGLTHVDPERTVNGWSTDDDSSKGGDIHLGYHFNKRWFAELKYADMGEAGLGNTNPAVDAALPDAVITYKVPSLMAGYQLIDGKRWKVYAKAGASVIATKAENSRFPGLASSSVERDEVSSAQLALGAGVTYRFGHSRWFARLNVDSYDRDAWYAGLSLSRYFGGEKPKRPEPAPAPVVAAPVPAPEPAKVVEPVIECEKFNGVIDNVNFVTNSAELTAPARSSLDNYTAGLLEFPNVAVRVSAHTDSVGSAAYNQRLSDARARSVMSYMIGRGVVASQLSSVGYGENRPIADNNTAAGRAQNRRVEITVSSDQCRK